MYSTAMLSHSTVHRTLHTNKFQFTVLSCTGSNYEMNEMLFSRRDASSRYPKAHPPVVQDFKSQFLDFCGCVFLELELKPVLYHGWHTILIGSIWVWAKTLVH